MEQIDRLFNPCLDYCYLHNGKQYSSECDKSCEFAKIAKELTKIMMESYSPEEVLDMLDGLEEDDIQYSILTKKTQHLSDDQWRWLMSNVRQIVEGRKR